MVVVYGLEAIASYNLGNRGCSSMVELLLPKQIAWVRFPSPAPKISTLFTCDLGRMRLQATRSRLLMRIVKTVCQALNRPWYLLSGFRCLMLIALFSTETTAIAAGEKVQLAVLMAAPNVAPAPPIPRSVISIEDLHPARRAIELNPIHDETSPAYLRLQRIDEATQHLKRDSLGFPDWMSSIRSGAITPRAGLSPTEKMNVLDLDIVMKNTKEMPNVLFPHQSHTLWLDCSNCHPVPFLPKTGTNPVTMSEIFRGNYCGMCHDRVAFITFFACVRCHRVPQDSSATGK